MQPDRLQISSVLLKKSFFTCRSLSPAFSSDNQARPLSSIQRPLLASFMFSWTVATSWGEYISTS